MRKLAYRVHTKNYLLDNNTRHRDDYIPQLYIKLKNWNPPPASLITEDRMTLFEKRLREASRINSLQTHYFTSLTPSQKQTLNEFKHSKEFIVIPTDKNFRSCGDE
jgi:hypothetical protein